MSGFQENWPKIRPFAKILGIALSGGLAASAISVGWVFGGAFFAIGTAGLLVYFVEM